MRKTNIKLRYLVNFIAILLLFAAVVAMGMAGGNTMKLKITPSIWQCSYLIIMAASLNLVLGFLGQLSLGHCGFMAVGAYAAALISLAFQRAGFYTEKSGAAFLLGLNQQQGSPALLAPWMSVDRESPMTSVFSGVISGTWRRT